MVVALPETEAEVVAILKVCAARGVPVVARGAGTGLSGGAQPHRFGLVLSLARFKKIVKIDAPGQAHLFDAGTGGGGEDDGGGCNVSASSAGGKDLLFAATTSLAVLGLLQARRRKKS